MSRIGQCPSCRSIYELDDSDVGQVFQCECEVTLFAADAAGFGEIPVFCSQCDGAYVVDSEGAGEDVECECGATITVPTMVLRSPVSSRGETAADATQNAHVESTSDSVLQDSNATDSVVADDQAVINCPECETQYSVTESDIDVQATCECGSVFVISQDADDELVVVIVDDSEVVEPVTDEALDRTIAENERDASDDTKLRRQERAKSREKKRSPWTLAGIGLVGLFLLASIVMFALRQSGALETAEKQPPAPKPRPPISDSALAVGPSSSTSDDRSIVPAGSAANAIETNPTDGDSTTANASSMVTESAIPDPSKTNASVPSANTSLAPIPAPSTTASSDAATSRNETTARKPSHFAPPPLKELPQATAPRPVIPVVTVPARGLTFARAFDEAYAEYTKMRELQAESAKSGDAEPFNKQLGKTIGRLQQALAIGSRQTDNDRLHELRYLLTYSYYHAGRLPEASILGEAVARWGKKTNPATKEAALIGLAATQEASQTQWGLADQVGELDRMASITDVLASRWPNDNQLDLIRLNLAQTYDRFNQPQKAAGVYRSIPESSPHYATSQLAAGSALWIHFRRQVDSVKQPTSGEQKNQAGIRDRARTSLTAGVNKLLAAEDAKPTQQILTAKLSLARIELSAGNLSAAEEWLTKPPMAVTESISTKQAEGMVKFSPIVLRSVYQTLFSIRSQQNNPAGAKEALTLMAEKMGKSNSAEMGRMYLGVATDFIDQLQRSPSITREQFSTLVELIEPLKDSGATLTASNLLWLGESWHELSAKAANPNLGVQCNEKAAAAYALAMANKNFPASSRMAALIRQSKFLRAAGQLDKAIESLTAVLKESPNSFGMQLEATEAIQQSAIDAGNPLALVDAVSGPADSPVWGWGKLVTILRGAVSQDESNATNIQRLMNSQYELAHCKWLITKATPDPAQKADRMRELQRLLLRLDTTMKRDVQPWYDEFSRLKTEISQAGG